MKLTLEEHGDFIRDALAAGKSRHQISLDLRCGETTVARFVKKYPELAPAAKVKRKVAFVPGAPVDNVEVLEAELKELRAAARKDRKSDVLAERLANEMRAITQVAEPIYEAPERAEGHGHPHAHVLLLSDTHVGEVVDREAMNGLGEYNFEICLQRMANIAKALVSFQNNRPYPIDELRIWLLGDMTGGKHHQELAETNEFGLAMQSYLTGKMLGEFIESLVEAYPSIYVTGIAGNHPRMNPKHQSKQVFDSFDWLAYQHVELYLSRYGSVTTQFPLAGFTVDHVAGKTILLGHGDGIKSTMPGVPWGGVMRRFNELRKTYAQVGEHLDYFALGHFHQLNVVKGIFMNGSVIGPNEYALKQFGAADPPEQLLLTFDKQAERLTDVSFINP